MRFTLVLFFSLLTFIGWCQQIPLRYEIDLLRSADTIAVSAFVVGELPKKEAIYQFAATAPGTYQTMHIGRLVSNFQVFNKKGKRLAVEYIKPNQYKIEQPHKVHRISYQVAETFDTPLPRFPIYMMCGSSLEEGHALINHHTIIGYFHGQQNQPIEVKFLHPENWKVGTSLSTKDGYYQADNYDHLVDSPILMGELSYADTLLAGTPIEIYTYSASQQFESKKLLTLMSDMLGASKDFLMDLPVDRYTFLYLFEPNPSGQTGAWEHSYSSEYVLAERSPTPQYLARVTDIASHEFFHIVTPLNIHSEIIESFNFIKPTPSIHLWFYEGVTEWASNMLLYRGGVVDLDTYISESIQKKIYVDDEYFNPQWSLQKIAEESFNPEGAKQYGNVYYRGSLIAGLLDIQLLDLSDGTYGLRELILDLIQKFGKGKPVKEDTFFDDMAAMTYPEIREFFSKYVENSEPLPHEEFLNKIGIAVDGKKGKRTLKKMDNLSERQQLLFDAWSKNLPVVAE